MPGSTKEAPNATTNPTTYPMRPVGAHGWFLHGLAAGIVTARRFRIVMTVLAEMREEMFECSVSKVSPGVRFAPSPPPPHPHLREEKALFPKF